MSTLIPYLTNYYWLMLYDVFITKFLFLFSRLSNLFDGNILNGINPYEPVNSPSFDVLSSPSWKFWIV